MPSQWELLLRLLFACALGGAVGLERELSGQGAGFRTHILVALGSALFTLVSAYAFLSSHVDPTRIAAQVVSGIGFLGAGAILRGGSGVRGLTTAASLWVVAALGVGAGAGFYAPTTLAAALALLSLWGLKGVRRRLRSEHGEKRLILAVTVEREVDLPGMVQRLRGDRGRVDRVHVEKEGLGTRTITVGLRLPAGQPPEEVAARVGDMPGVRDVDWSR
jgi:putative Mg2+ transporter-C (MgtC) family protein